MKNNRELKISSFHRTRTVTCFSRRFLQIPHLSVTKNATLRRVRICSSEIFQKSPVNGGINIRWPEKGVGVDVVGDVVGRS